MSCYFDYLIVLHLSVSNLSCFMTTAALKYLIRIENENWDGDSITHTVMCFWLLRRKNLINDYSLVGYILSPNPTIMEHAVAHKTRAHMDAAKRLIVKLFVKPKLVGNDRTMAIAKVYDKFLDEYRDFSNKIGVYGNEMIWVIAALPETKAHIWHAKYSLLNTEVLGKLACLVTSKILGIGTAERNWKQVKAVKSGQRVNTGMDKTKKQVLIHALYGQLRAESKNAALASAGKLWNDEDFASLKMDIFCKEIRNSLAAEDQQSRSQPLRLWLEHWEKAKLTPTPTIVHSVLEGRLITKYCGLKFYDTTFGSDDPMVMTVHPSKVKFVPKHQGKSKFQLYATYSEDGSDDDVDKLGSLWQLVDIDADFFHGLRRFYDENKGHGGVECYEKGSDCLSDHGDDE